MQIFVFLALIIAVIAVIFALQNTLIVTVSFLFWEFTGSLALVLLLALAVGALISFLASLPAIIRGMWSLRTQRKRTVELDKNLADHKLQLTELEGSLAEHKQRLAELESSLAEHKQLLQAAQLKLQAQPASFHPPAEGAPPTDQPPPAA